MNKRVVKIRISQKSCSQISFEESRWHPRCLFPDWYLPRTRSRMSGLLPTLISPTRVGAPRAEIRNKVFGRNATYNKPCVRISFVIWRVMFQCVCVRGYGGKGIKLTAVVIRKLRSFMPK